MTTQMPYEPAPAPPMPAYPTAPPWAPPAPPAALEGPPWAGTPYTRHGQLMVPYPELMNAAGRSTPPSWMPVAVVSFLLPMLGTVLAAAVCTLVLGRLGGILLGAAGGALGLLGAIPAARRARQARQSANPRYPYWLAFGLALVASGLPALVALGATGSLVQARLVEPAAVRAVQSDMLHGAKIAVPAGVTVQGVRCTAVGSRRRDGLRAYSCLVTLSSGQSGALRVVADRKGEWAAVKTN